MIPRILNRKCRFENGVKLLISYSKLNRTGHVRISIAKDLLQNFISWIKSKGEMEKLNLSLLGRSRGSQMNSGTLVAHLKDGWVDFEKTIRENIFVNVRLIYWWT